jgi:probable addiction module antidote protein
MRKMKTKPFDPAEYLDDDESIAAYMTDALESGDPSFVADALGVIARARGMSDVAREAGVSRESLYRECRWQSRICDGDAGCAGARPETLCCPGARDDIISDLPPPEPQMQVCAAESEGNAAGGVPGGRTLFRAQAEIARQVALALRKATRNSKSSFDSGRRATTAGNHTGDPRQYFALTGSSGE